MTMNVKSMLAEANAAVTKLLPAEAAVMIKAGNVLVVDVRDANEVQQSGKVRGAINISRGMIEFRADAETPYFNPAFKKDGTVLLYCASGGRSALASKRLMEMGYNKVCNIGSFKDLAEAGVPVAAA
jgi:rhodanese-related sulfurtransferase